MYHNLSFSLLTVAMVTISAMATSNPTSTPDLQYNDYEDEYDGFGEFLLQLIDQVKDDLEDDIDKVRDDLEEDLEDNLREERETRARENNELRNEVNHLLGDLEVERSKLNSKYKSVRLDFFPMLCFYLPDYS